MFVCVCVCVCVFVYINKSVVCGLAIPIFYPLFVVLSLYLYVLHALETDINFIYIYIYKLYIA